MWIQVLCFVLFCFVPCLPSYTTVPVQHPCSTRTSIIAPFKNEKDFYRNVLATSSSRKTQIASIGHTHRRTSRGDPKTSQQQKSREQSLSLSLPLNDKKFLIGAIDSETPNHLHRVDHNNFSTHINLNIQLEHSLPLEGKCTGSASLWTRVVLHACCNFQIIESS